MSEAEPGDPGLAAELERLITFSTFALWSRALGWACLGGLCGIFVLPGLYVIGLSVTPAGSEASELWWLWPVYALAGAIPFAWAGEARGATLCLGYLTSTPKLAAAMAAARAAGALAVGASAAWLESQVAATDKRGEAVRRALLRRVERHLRRHLRGVEVTELKALIEAITEAAQRAAARRTAIALLIASALFSVAPALALRP